MVFPFPIVPVSEYTPHNNICAPFLSHPMYNCVSFFLHLEDLQNASQVPDVHNTGCNMVTPLPTWDRDQRPPSSAGTTQCMTGPCIWNQQHIHKHFD